MVQEGGFLWSRCFAGLAIIHLSSDYGVRVDMGLSLQFMESSVNASGSDGRKEGSRLSIIPELAQF